MRNLTPVFLIGAFAALYFAFIRYPLLDSGAALGLFAVGFLMGGLFFRSARNNLVVRSWRPGRTDESVYINSFAPFYFRGQTVTVGVRSGALGLPWISSVLR